MPTIRYFLLVLVLFNFSIIPVASAASALVNQTALAEHDLLTAGRAQLAFPFITLRAASAIFVYRKGRITT